MRGFVVRQHLARAWRRHWGLQVASVSVMSLVLLILNLMGLGYSAFDQMITQWGQGLEMIVYLKEGLPPTALEQLKTKLQASGEFAKVQYVSKNEATKKFLKVLGPDSLQLLSDPKWSSPIPASFELQLSDHIPVGRRVASLQSWSARLHSEASVDDVFYGQGWVENLSRFIRGAKGVVGLLWVLGLSVGLLIVGNCIRLSFLQRREEIEILELVGATTRFIRWPFLLEGICIGFLASIFSLVLSWGLHSFLLDWIGHTWNFWFALGRVEPLQGWIILLNLATGISFGAIGAWNCVRKLNTGWAAAD